MTPRPPGSTLFPYTTLFRSALALSLAAIGVYGVMSLLVSERTQEVGVRLALGAHPIQMLKMLVGQALRLALVGVADRKSTRLNSSHSQISYAVFCLEKKKTR